MMKKINIFFSLLYVSFFISFLAVSQGQTKFFKGKSIESLATNGNDIIAFEWTILSHNNQNILHGIIHLSENGGLNWKTLPTTTHTTSLIAIDKDQTIYSGDFDNVDKALLRSKDKGLNWETIQPEGRAGNYLLTCIDNVLYAAFDGISDTRIYQSKNKGETWQILTENVFVNAQSQVYFQKVDNNYFILGGIHKDFQITAEGIIRYNAIDNTTELISNHSQVAYSFYIKKDNHIIMQGGDFGSTGLQYVSNNFGQTWEEKFSFGKWSNLISVVESENGVLYAHTSNGIFYSEDNAESWNFLSIIDEGEELNPNWINKILVVKNTLFVATFFGLIRIGDDIITSTEKDETFKLGPNPSTSDVTVLIKKELIEVNIINAIGKKSSLQFQKQSDTEYSLNTSTLEPGVYVVELVTKFGKETARFVKR